MGPGNRAWLARHMMQDRRDPGARAFAEFAQKAIDLVQFEYGEINLKTRDFLEDYYKFFTTRGFVVGKLYPEGVMFKDYDLADEDFLGPNYIACRAERADMIAALRFPAMARYPAARANSAM